jgi:hypothetical protein
MESRNINLETQFKLASFRQQVEVMSLEECHQLLIQLFTEYLIQQESYKKIIAQQWGIEPNLDQMG